MLSTDRKIDFRYPNHGGCLALAAWLAEQFDQGKRTSITMEDDVMVIHSADYAFRMSIKPASNGCFCCHVQADDTILTAVKIAHSDNQITALETARFIVRTLEIDPKALRVYAENILKDNDLMRTLKLLEPGIEGELRVLMIEQAFTV